MDNYLDLLNDDLVCIIGEYICSTDVINLLIAKQQKCWATKHFNEKNK